MLEEEEPESPEEVGLEEFGEGYNDIPLSSSTDGGVFASHGGWHYPGDPQVASNIPQWTLTPKTKAKKWKVCNHEGASKDDVAKDLGKLSFREKTDDSKVYFDSLNRQEEDSKEPPLFSGSEDRHNVSEAALEPDKYPKYDSPRGSESSDLPHHVEESPRSKVPSNHFITSVLVSSVFEALNLEEECEAEDDVAEDELEEYLDPMVSTTVDKKSSYKDFLFNELWKHADQSMIKWVPSTASEINVDVGTRAWASCASDPAESGSGQLIKPTDSVTESKTESWTLTSSAYVNSPPITSFAVPYVTPEPFRLDGGSSNGEVVADTQNKVNDDNERKQDEHDEGQSDARSTSASTTAGGWVPTPEFWSVFSRRVLCKWVWECLEDCVEQDSYRQKFLAASIQHVPGTRMWIAKALAEVSCDHLETFLRDLQLRRAGGSWTAEVEAARAARTGCRRILGPVEDGSVLAELLCYLVNVVTEACSSLKPNAPPVMATWLTAQLELCARTLVNLCRTRPILDSYFNHLNGCICRMLPVRPHLAIMLLKRFLAAWPTRDGLREVSWLKLTQTVLLSCPAPVICGSDVRMPLFKRIVCCLKSDHAAVAKTALELTANMYLLLHYILPFPDISSAVNSALVENRSHWNRDIREMSEEQFDQMLDYQ